MLRGLFIATCAFAAVVGDAEPQDCRYEAERSATVEVADARMLVVEAGSGSLRVEGRADASDVRIRGRACASDQELLEQLDFDAARRGDAIEVITRDVDSDGGWRNRRYARLDLVIELPAGFAAAIHDGSGELVLRNLGETSVEDGSGEIDIAGIAGPLELSDGSGELTIREVDGDVDIEDGSGEIDITGVAGTVRIDDASGSIAVDDIGGGFVVTSDGSGSIRHSGVRGNVDVPRKGRRG
ncbi:MAG: hypothetical protein ACRELX_04565 [Longimicrobiales bacterium]